MLDGDGNWIYCNDTAAEYLGQERQWFPGRNLFQELPTLLRDWRGVIAEVASTRQTYIDRSRRGLLAIQVGQAGQEPAEAWSVLAFPITLHDGRNGVVLTARMLGHSAA